MIRQFFSNWPRKLGWLFLFVVILVTIVTGLGLPGQAEEGGDTSFTFLILIYVNLFLALTLGFLVIRNLARLWMDRKRGMVGARLRTRMATVFVLMTLMPTLVIAMLSVQLLNRGVDSWFSERISTALSQSLEVAKAYYQESQRTIRHDAESLVRNPTVTSSLALAGPEASQEILEVERKALGLDEIAILRPDGSRLARAGELPFDPLPDLTTLAEGSTKAILVTNDEGDRVRAFVRLGSDRFLSTGRWIDRQILGQMETMEAAYVNYGQLRASHGLLRVTHTVTLALITLLLLLGAVWSGFRMADRLTNPIAELVVGTEKVASGDLETTIEVTGKDEIATLMSSFNAMTERLAANQEELEANYHLLEERRRSMDAMVNNISAGVISVDRLGKVALMNSAAEILFGVKHMEGVGRPYAEIVPEEVIRPLIDLLNTTREASGSDPGTFTTQIEFQGPERRMTLVGGVTPLEDAQGVTQGFVVTFDDLTEVLLAQRAHAWSDIARRIAHEIKNPLTPIQLSAQRMRRKYLKAECAEGDWSVLDECTNTIVNQVEDLRVLVNEFSNFARLPRANLQLEDLNAAINEVLVLHQPHGKKIKSQIKLSKKIPQFAFDRGQIKQVFTNLVANAMAAIEENPDVEKGRLAITTDLAENKREVVIEVADNGSGILPENRDRLFEPYFTTKRKGTGLGLAIVKKIVEDHQGAIRIRASDWDGALVELRLPLRQLDALTDEEELRNQNAT